MSTIYRLDLDDECSLEGTARRNGPVGCRPGTPRDLLAAAWRGARAAAQHYHASGLDDTAVRRRIIGRFKAEYMDTGYDPYEDETLMAVVQRAIDEVLEGHDPSVLDGDA